MTDIFRSARLTLNRAQYHIHDFNTVISDFIDGRPWAEFIDRDSEPGKEIHKIRFVRELPETLPCVLFDAVNNLCAVLDQSGYGAAVASGNANPTKCTFPFGDTLAEIENNINGRKACKHLPPEILALFLSFKPYKGSGGSGEPLWALNKLCNAKKHCTLAPVWITNAFANFSAALPEGTPVGKFQDADGTYRGWDASKREMTLVTVPQGLDPHISGHMSYEVAIDGVEAVAGKPATGVLNSMSAIVQGVLTKTEAECRRLGFIT
jgi:hypothetical protein